MLSNKKQVFFGVVILILSVSTLYACQSMAVLPVVEDVYADDSMQDAAFQQIRYSSNRTVIDGMPNADENQSSETDIPAVQDASVTLTASPTSQEESPDLATPSATSISPALNNAQVNDNNLIAAAEGSVPPINDDFDAAIDIVTIPYQDTQDITAATVSTYDPNINDPQYYTPYNTVWYKFTPQFSGLVIVDTFGSNYTTSITAWIGTRELLQPKGIVSPFTPRSSMAFMATSLQTYYIMVSSSNPGGGQLVFNLSQQTSSVGPGTYDDTDSHIFYSGDWQAASQAGTYNNTYHYTSYNRDTAYLTFNGTGVKLIYSKAPGYGIARIYLDGVIQSEVNMEGSSLQTQLEHDVSPISPGQHSIYVINVNSNAKVGVDAFIVSDSPFSPTVTDTPTVTNTPIPGSTPEPFGPGKYDDDDARITYGGSWSTSTQGSMYNLSYHYSTSIGDTASVLFNADKIKLVYYKQSGYGTATVLIDGVNVGTIDMRASTLQTQLEWSSGMLSSGYHTLTLVHATGTYVDLDAIIVGEPAAALGYGKYDDSHQSIVYEGGWSSALDDRMYNGTYHYSTGTNCTASVVFDGEGITLVYYKKYGNGSPNVIIDGVDVGTINMVGSSLETQLEWSSPVLPSGIHTMTLEQRAGFPIGLDAIVVSGPPLTATLEPFGTGKYDDRHPSITYSGSWSTSTLASMYNGTYHYSTGIGDTASLMFNGQLVKLIYYKQSGYGTATVSIDGVNVGTIDMGGSTLQTQLEWSSETLSSGYHTLTLVHATGTYVDLDGIFVSETGSGSGYGKYDDTYPSIVYNGGWFTATDGRMYSGTYHYTPGDTTSVSIPFNGESITVIYYRQSGYGLATVRIDGVLVGYISMNGIDLETQLEWSSTTLAPGSHILVLESNAAFKINLDGYIVGGPRPTVTPFAYGQYDDNETGILYNGGWVLYPDSSMSNGNYHSSKVIGDTASILFNGESIKVIYPTKSYLGKMFARIDGVLAGAIDMSVSSPQNHLEWSSGTLASGDHTLTLEHATGSFVDLDGFSVGGPLPAATPLPYGKYDDMHPSIIYSGSWVPSTSSGMYTLTYHDSTQIGDTATVEFNGDLVKLIYFKNPGYGTATVRIDGVSVGTIDMYGSTAQTQLEWTSGLLTSGNHTLTLEHISGSKINLDGVNVAGPAPTSTSTPTPTYTPSPTATQPALGYGKYDDTNPSIVYTGVVYGPGGSWVSITDSRMYNGTYHDSTQIGDKAALIFNGESVRVVYAKQDYGTMNVLIDGIQVGIIDMGAGNLQPQQEWSSRTLPSGYHTFSLETDSGINHNLDAIIVDGPLPTPTPLGPGTYEDTDYSIIYSGPWEAYDDHNGYTHQRSLAIGNTASIRFNGDMVKIVYMKYINYGTATVKIDGVDVGTIDMSGSSIKQNEWSSGNIVYGAHTLTLVHTSGTSINLDQIIIPTPAPTATYTPTATATMAPLGLGKYDDANANIVYRGNWSDSTLSSMYNGTYHYSTKIGDTTTTAFKGESVRLVYYKQSGYGTVTVHIDGVDVGTIDMGGRTLQTQLEWVSGSLGSGDHTLTLVHATGNYVDLDGIVIAGPPPTATNTLTPTNTATATQTATATATMAPLGLGKYDDPHGGIVYSGNWYDSTLSSMYNATYHYSTKAGDTAALTFNGDSVKLVYYKQSGYGTATVRIDGVDVGTINMGGSTLQTQLEWVSGSLGSGDHTLTLVHAAGGYVDLDGIVIAGPPPTATNTLTPTNTATATYTPTATATMAPLGLGKYDDPHGGIVYSGNWYDSTLSSMYNATYHYSTKAGDTATLTFNGDSVKLVYYKQSGYGTATVRIDGVDVGTINMGGSTLQTQLEWVSGSLGSGDHTLTLVHTLGTYIDLDGIIIP